MSILADDALELLDHLKISKAHVMGISMGGMIALTLALRYPSRVASLTIGCSTARPKKYSFNPHAVASMIDSLRLGGTLGPLLFSRQFRTNHPDLVKDFESRVASQTVSKKVFWKQIKACWSFDVLDRVSQIKAPTLIMTGDRDALMPPECSHELAHALPGSLLKVFPGSGHAFMLENQSAVLELVTHHWRQA
jgi:pimeloyl-ACP methyl ester carboxylesterase